MIPKIPIEERIRQGIVIRYKKLPVETGERNKFFVLLNHDCTQEKIYYFLTTSKIEYWKNHPAPEEVFVYIPENAIWFFHQPTLIDCSKPREIDRLKLKRKYNKRGLIVKGMLPKRFMDKVIHIIEQSKLISERVKKLILLS